MRIAAGRFGDLAATLTRRETDINSAAIGMSRQFHYYTSARAKSELGYRFRDIEQTVSDAWTWFQQNGYV